MNGSVQQKNNKWWYTVIDGKWQSTGIPYPGNKKQATVILKQRMAEKVREKVTDKTKSVNDRVTVTQLLDLYLNKAKNNIRATTYSRCLYNAQKIKDYYAAVG